MKGWKVEKKTEMRENEGKGNKYRKKGREKVERERRRYR